MADDAVPPESGPGRGADARSEGRSGPTALPGSGARVVAFLAILVAGACGGLIGRAFVGLQCEGDCSLDKGLGALAGAIIAAVGVAVIAVLVLRAMGEWRAVEGSTSRS